MELSAEAWNRSNRIRDFASAATLESENPKISASQKRHMKHFARWVSTYRVRISRALRDETLARFHEINSVHARTRLGDNSEIANHSP